MSKQQQQTSGGWGFAVGILVGTVVGAAAAILLTPQSGVETRDRLVITARKVQTQASDLAEDLKKRTRGPKPETGTNDGLSSEGVTVL